MQDMTNQALATIKEKHTFVSNQLEQSRSRLLALAVATNLEPSRVIAVALDVLQQKPELLTCTPQSIVRSVILAAECGLEINAFGEAYLVPFKNKGVEKATMMIGYRGFIKLVQQHARRPLHSIKGVLVREADTFHVDEGKNELTHVLGKGDRRERGAVIHAYSMVRYVDGGIDFEVMDRVDLDAIQSKAGGMSPWKNGGELAIGEMQKKCPIRRHAKRLPLSSFAKDAVSKDDHEAMRRGEFGGEIREDFQTGRAQDLKDILAAKDNPVPVIEADFDEAT